MLTHALIDSFLFWAFLVLVVGSAIYSIKTAIKIFEYEKQVDRSWNDLLYRADEMIKKLNDLIFEVRDMREETKKTISKTKKINQKLNSTKK